MQRYILFLISLLLLLASFLPSTVLLNLLILYLHALLLFVVGVLSLIAILRTTERLSMLTVVIVFPGDGRENDGAPADGPTAEPPEEEVVGPPVNNDAGPAPETNTTSSEDNVEAGAQTGGPVPQGNSSGGSQTTSSSGSDVVTFQGNSPRRVRRPHVPAQQATVQPRPLASGQAAQDNAGEGSGSGQQNVEAEGSEPSSDSQGGGLDFHGNGHATAAELQGTANSDGQANAGAHGLPDIEEEGSDSTTDDRVDGL